MAIGLSPRLRIGGLGDRMVDLRLQDFLLVAGIVVLVISPRTCTFRSMRRVWGDWFLMFAVVAGLTTFIHMLTGQIPVILRVAFLGRTVEAFILSAVVCGLYLNSGRDARRISLKTLHITIVANSAWVGYQLATGTRATLFGADISAGTYGPQLVGEPSAFGTGAFFVFTAALGVAEFRSKIAGRSWAVLLVLAGGAGAFLSGSRVSIAGAVFVAVVLLFRTANNRHPNIILPLAVLSLLALVVSGTEWNLHDRFTLAGVERSLAVRVAGIWGPIGAVILDHPILGIGPGALGTEEYPWSEAHSIFLRAFLDYGVVGALLFFMVFAAVTRRAYVSSRIVDFGPHLPTFATATVLIVSSFAIAGLFQESFTAVMSTHLMMLAIGLFAGEYSAHERLNETRSSLTDKQSIARHCVT